MKGYYYDRVGPGPDIEVQTMSWANCQEECKLSFSCHYFSWWPDGGCVLADYTGKLVDSDLACDKWTAKKQNAGKVCAGDFVMSGPKTCEDPSSFPNTKGLQVPKEYEPTVAPAVNKTKLQDGTVGGAAGHKGSSLVWVWVLIPIILVALLGVAAFVAWRMGMFGGQAKLPAGGAKGGAGGRQRAAPGARGQKPAAGGAGSGNEGRPGASSGRGRSSSDGAAPAPAAAAAAGGSARQVGVRPGASRRKRGVAGGLLADGPEDEAEQMLLEPLAEGQDVEAGEQAEGQRFATVGAPIVAPGLAPYYVAAGPPRYSYAAPMHGTAMQLPYPVVPVVTVVRAPVTTAVVQQGWSPVSAQPETA